MDPLADGKIPSLAVHQPPQITSLRPIQQPADNYQRSLRHYIGIFFEWLRLTTSFLVTKEDKFTLLMFDPKRGYAHWMLVDIPSASLATGSIADDALQVRQKLKIRVLDSVLRSTDSGQAERVLLRVVHALPTA